MRSVKYGRESSKVNALLYQVGRSIPHSQVKDEKVFGEGKRLWMAGFYSWCDTTVRLNGTGRFQIPKSRKMNNLFSKLTAWSEQTEATKTAAMFFVPHTIFWNAWQCYQRFMLTCTHWDREGGGHIIWAHWVICIYLKLHCAVFFSNRPCQITFKHQACICHLIILSMHSWQPWSLVHYSGSAHTLDEACRSITTMRYHFICAVAVYTATHLKYLLILNHIHYGLDCRLHLKIFCQFNKK